MMQSDEEQKKSNSLPTTSAEFGSSMETLLWPTLPPVLPVFPPTAAAGGTAGSEDTHTRPVQVL